MQFPDSYSISKKAKDSFQTIKNRTDVNINALCRMAIMLAINSGDAIGSAVRGDSEGQTLPRHLMFGDLADTYEILIRQYIHDSSIEMSPGQVVASLVEIGVHKMAHCRSIEDLCALK